MAVAREIAQPLPKAPVHDLQRHDVGWGKRQENAVPELNVIASLACSSPAINASACWMEMLSERP